MTKRWLAASSALILAACSRGPGPVHVGSIRVADGPASAALREGGVEDAALEQAAREALGAAGFRLSAGARLHRARVDVLGVRLAPAAPGLGARAEVAIEIELSPADPQAPDRARREAGTAAVDLAGAATPRDAWLGAIGQAARHAADALALGFVEDAKRTADLLADLSAADASVREHAVRVVADRRSRAAVPVLVARLQEEEPRLAQRIVAALAQIGDERAVPALIELSRTADPPAASRLVRFIGDIGGAEAEGYLLTLESGHPDARIRRSAREALADMRARAKEPVAVRK